MLESILNKIEWGGVGIFLYIASVSKYLYILPGGSFKIFLKT